MNVFIISDSEFHSEAYHNCMHTLRTFFENKGYGLEEVVINRDSLTFCMGCFGCWIKKPGECVIDDSITELNRKQMNSDVVIFLTPVVFGQFSANMKNVIDRWLPNMLPFFIKRPDGSTMHPPRYSSYPRQIMLGYGSKLSQKEEQLFEDITKKHRSEINVLFWQQDGEALVKELETMSFERVRNGV